MAKKLIKINPGIQAKGTTELELCCHRGLVAVNEEKTFLSVKKDIFLSILYF